MLKLMLTLAPCTISADPLGIRATLTLSQTAVDGRLAQPVASQVQGGWSFCWRGSFQVCWGYRRSIYQALYWAIYANPETLDFAAEKSAAKG